MKTRSKQHLEGSSGCNLQRLRAQAAYVSLLLIDSSRIAVRLSAWRDENEKARLDSLCSFACLEAQNYNMSILSEQMAIQGGSIANLQDALGDKSVVPETRTELSLLSDTPLMIERPGYPGDMVDIRSVATTLKLSAHSITDRWRQMARLLLDKLLPKPVQYVYTAASKATAYFALPQEFIKAIIDVCAISSNLTEEGLVSFLPAISSHVRESLTNRLNENRKKQGRTIDEYVKDAVGTGWTPPGVTRQGAASVYTIQQIGSALISTSTESTPKTPRENSNEFATDNSMGDNHSLSKRPYAGQTPLTSHLKRRGPIGLRGSKIMKKENEGVQAEVAPTLSPSTPVHSTVYELSPNQAGPSTSTASMANRPSTWSAEQKYLHLERNDAPTYTELAPMGVQPMYYDRTPLEGHPSSGDFKRFNYTTGMYETIEENTHY